MGGAGQVTLTWTSNGDGGATITKWQYVQKEGDDAFETTWTDIAGSGESTTTHTVAGLSNGTAYRFKVRAVNANGNSAASPESEAVTPSAAPPAPGRPAVAGGDRQVTLTWTSNGNGGSAITEWEYQQKEGSGDWGSWADVCATASDADCPGKTSWTVTDLSNGTAYRFRVRAVNANGNGAASPESEAVTPSAAPPAPSRPAVMGGAGQVTLTWTSNGDGGATITKWQYVQKEGDDAFETTWTDIAGSGESTTTHTVAGLSNGTAYRFKGARGERQWQRRRVARVRGGDPVGGTSGAGQAGGGGRCRAGHADVDLERRRRLRDHRVGVPAEGRLRRLGLLDRCLRDGERRRLPEQEPPGPSRT